MLTRPCPMGPRDGPWTVNESGRFRSVSFPSPNQTLPNTWSPTDRSIGQKLKVSTLQSYNPTSYSINAYKFMANTAFNRSFLPPICVVIWIYFLYYSGFPHNRENGKSPWNWILRSRPWKSPWIRQMWSKSGKSTGKRNRCRAAFLI